MDFNLKIKFILENFQDYYNSHLDCSGFVKRVEGFKLRIKQAKCPKMGVAGYGFLG